MPVDFLTEEQKSFYGRFAEDPSPTQLARYFHLDDTDRVLIGRRRGDHNRLGFALQLTTLRFLGTFLPDAKDVPKRVIEYVGGQLGITDPDGLSRYLERWTTRNEHQAEIRDAYGYRDFTAQPDHFRFLRWLYLRAWFNAERPSMLFDLATSWLVERKVLLPGVTTLERLVATIRERTATRLWRLLAATPTALQRRLLEDLLVVPDGDRQSPLDRLRQSPTRVSGPSLVDALKRFNIFRSLGTHQLDLDSVPPSRVKALGRYAASMWVPNIARMPDERRMATLLSFACLFEVTSLDDALDLLDLLITDLLSEAEKIGKKERLRTLRDLDAAALTLKEACTVLLDESCGDPSVRPTAFSRVSPGEIERAIATVESLARPKAERYEKELVDRYRRVRRFLPALLNTVDFQAAPSGTAVLRAVEFLQSMEGESRPDLSGAPLEVVSKAWRRLVLGEDRRVDRRAYTLCVVKKLQDALRRRDVFVPGSERWSDPRAKLLQGKEWESMRPKICQSLDHERTATAALTDFAHVLDETYKRVAGNLQDNAAVRIEPRDGRDRLVLTGLDELPEPESLVELRQTVAALLPRVDLPEALLEIHVHTGFANEFTHVSENDARVSDLPVSVCAVLLAEACNIGLEPLVQPDRPALTRGRLTWVQQNYFRTETLTRANAKLVDAQAAIPLVQAWGGGEVASADGLRFVTPVRTLNAGYNPKYFGKERGITYYNFTSNQFSGLHGIVVPGTLRDSIFILQGCLEQQTSLRPMEIMSDTAGASNIVFGLFWLLGYQFSPRLADLGSVKLWRMDSEADYGALNELSQNHIPTDRIEKNWDDMLRAAGSLKVGTVSASELIRSLLRSDRPSTLTKAIGDLGRLSKTLFILNYIDDEAYRRRILTQLNRQESRHTLARATFHGKRGEVRKKYRQGQEEQLGALGLVTNVLVLWNTLYMDATLEHLRSQGVGVNPEDVARLSPLENRNINFLGHYSFSLTEPIARGELRPLRYATDE